VERSCDPRTFSGLLAGAGLVAAVGAFSTTSASTAPAWHMDVPLHEQTLWVLAFTRRRDIT
jgi:hypothetical protein